MASGPYHFFLKSLVVLSNSRETFGTLPSLRCGDFPFGFLCRYWVSNLMVVFEQYIEERKMCRSVLFWWFLVGPEDSIRRVADFVHVDVSFSAMRDGVPVCK